MVSRAGEEEGETGGFAAGAQAGDEALDVPGESQIWLDHLPLNSEGMGEVVKLGIRQKILTWKGVGWKAEFLPEKRLPLSDHLRSARRIMVNWCVHD